MRKNIAKVIDAFRRGESARGDSKGTCWTNGESIFSYANQIVWRDPDGNLAFAERNSTRTTNSHISACRLSLSDTSDGRITHDEATEDRLR